MKSGIFISQTKYIKEILKTFGMEDSRPVSTPMSKEHKISEIDEYTDIKQTLYKSMIGKFQFFVYNRPYITLIVGIVARFSKNTKENHTMDVKWIMRYLKGTKDYGLYYKRSDRLY